MIKRRKKDDLLLILFKCMLKEQFFYYTLDMKSESWSFKSQNCFIGVWKHDFPTIVRVYSCSRAHGVKRWYQDSSKQVDQQPNFITFYTLGLSLGNNEILQNVKASCQKQDQKAPQKKGSKVQLNEDKASALMKGLNSRVSSVLVSICGWKGRL